MVRTHPGQIRGTPDTSPAKERRQRGRLYLGDTQFTSVTTSDLRFRHAILRTDEVLRGLYTYPTLQGPALKRIRVEVQGRRV